VIATHARRLPQLRGANATLIDQGLPAGLMMDLDDSDARIQFDPPSSRSESPEKQARQGYEQPVLPCDNLLMGTTVETYKLDIVWQDDGIDFSASKQYRLLHINKKQALTFDLSTRWSYQTKARAMECQVWHGCADQKQPRTSPSWSQRAPKSVCLDNLPYPALIGHAQLSSVLGCDPPSCLSDHFVCRERSHN
jgi:hypothetical protein